MYCALGLCVLGFVTGFHGKESAATYCSMGISELGLRPLNPSWTLRYLVRYFVKSFIKGVGSASDGLLGDLLLS